MRLVSFYPDQVISVLLPTAALLDERVADMQMRSHVYINNPNFQLSISGEAYVVFHVDTFIIIVEDVAMTNGFF